MYVFNSDTISLIRTDMPMRVWGNERMIYINLGNNNNTYTHSYIYIWIWGENKYPTRMIHFSFFYYIHVWFSTSIATVNIRYSPNSFPTQPWDFAATHPRLRLRIWNFILPIPTLFFCIVNILTISKNVAKYTNWLPPTQVKYNVTKYM